VSATTPLPLLKKNQLQIVKPAYDEISVLYVGIMAEKNLISTYEILGGEHSVSMSIHNQ
jgi:hypothetical protein